MEKQSRILRTRTGLPESGSILKRYDGSLRHRVLAHRAGGFALLRPQPPSRYDPSHPVASSGTLGFRLLYFVVWGVGHPAWNRREVVADVVDDEF